MANLAQLLEQASTLHRQGQLGDAERLYREILAVDNRSSKVLYLLGTLYFQVNQPDRAKELLEQALVGAPQNPEILNNLGAVLYNLGKHGEAIVRYQGAINAKPDYPEAHNNMGSALSKLGQHAKAKLHFEESLRLKPNYPLAHYNLGNAFRSLNQNKMAIPHYQEALRLQPRFLDALYNLGMALREDNRYDEAIKSYEQALALEPNHPQLLNNIGNLYREVGQPERALPLYEKALRLKPDYVDAYVNLGTSLRDLNRGEEAQVQYDKALRLNPNSVEAHINLGTTLQDYRKKEEALKHYNQALTLRPDSVHALWNKSLLLLSKGEFEEGWRLHENGLGHHDKRGLNLFPTKRWQGEDIKGKRLLIWSEQGLGDSLQFVRYAALCKAKGAYVIVQCPPTLKTIMETYSSIDKVVTKVAPEDFDYHIPMMSLPFAFATTLKTIPQGIPYFHVTKDLKAKWAERFAKYKGYKVGLVWAGNSRDRHIQGNLVDKRRSIDLGQFLPLLDIEGVQYFSLQMGPAAQQRAAHKLESKIIDCMAGVSDFMDTAAIIENLDLVISVDTSVVHLAGALGKPVWVLSRFDACWRWLDNREVNPWYPTARIFGQTELGKWNTVMERVREALTETVGKKKPLTTLKLNNEATAKRDKVSTAKPEPNIAKPGKVSPPKLDKGVAPKPDKVAVATPQKAVAAKPDKAASPKTDKSTLTKSDNKNRLKPKGKPSK